MVEQLGPEELELPYSAVVLRSHAGGYLVHVQGDFAGAPDPGQGQVLLCQPRGRLKKERVSIVTGDSVELDEYDVASGTAVITACRPRRNLLERPPLANVDQVVIVQAARQPDFSPLSCDRYLVHFQLLLPLSTPIICFNKCDLVDDIEVQRLRSIYEPLGYFVIFVSARTGLGIDELSECLSGKVSAFAGQSGVGKSSILNILSPELALRVGQMQNDFGVGRHTTTASELYRVDLQGAGERAATWIADTPGFNLYDFVHPEPKDVAAQFPEIRELAQLCRFANCLHLVEEGCAVLASLPDDYFEDDDDEFEGDEEIEGDEELEDVALDEDEVESDEDKELDERATSLSPDRYESYALMVSESQEKQAIARKTSSKVEANVKTIGGDKTRIPRLQQRYRTGSRRVDTQRAAEMAYENHDDDDFEDDLEDDE